MKTINLLLSFALLSLLGCGADEGPQLGAHRQAQASGKVAAIQYGPSTNSVNAVDPSCASTGMPSACAITKLIEDAVDQGAQLVVVPELALDQEYLELCPAIGDNPAQDDRWEEGVEFIDYFSRVAAQHGIVLIIHLHTIAAMRQDAPRHSTQVAFSPTGEVAALHHKFELYATERDSLTPGTTVTVFDTAVGKVGLLICADMYGDMRLHSRLVEELGAEIVAVSSYWTVAGGSRWQRAFAHNWGVFVVGANTTTGSGYGGGIYGPAGQVLAEHTQPSPALIVADLTAP